MKFKGLLKMAGDFMIKNSPTILTILGSAGVVSTAILTADATIKVMKDERCNEPFEKKIDYVKTYWTYYIPAIIVGGLSIGCIISANSVNSKRQFALASAYTLAENSLREYKDEVKNIIGERKEKEVHDNIAKKHVSENPPTNDIIVTGAGKTLFYDSYTGRYFESDIEKVKRIENELNKRLLSEMFIALNELYYEVGLPSVPAGNDMGWNVDEEGLIDIRYSAQIVTYKDKEVPCIVISYTVGPRFNVYGDFY